MDKYIASDMIKVILIGAAVFVTYAHAHAHAHAYAHGGSSKIRPKPVQTCGKNSYPDCGLNCGKKCSDYPPGSTNVVFSCAKVCQINGCECDPGHVYDNFTNSCVVPDDCRIKAVTCTKANQVYEICPAPCPRRVCGIDDTLIDCAASPQIGDAKCAPPACRCKQGYYQNDKGDCVLFEECPKCDAQNEIYEPCLYDCPPRRCDVDPRVIRCAAPPQLGDANCKGGCRCDDGYKRDAEGNCILEKECPPLCNGNEIASNCTNGGCFGPRYCSERGQDIKCVKLSEDQCKKGCLCKPPLLRNEITGDCVPEEKCPETPKCDEENQVFDYCPVGCPPRRCDVDPSLILCVTPPQLGDPECEPGCRCADGYKIGEEGKCIPEENCQVNPCKKENEVYQLCPRNCPPGVCGINDLAVTCAAVPDIDCPPPACKCKFGFYRNDRGDCVLFEDCPKCDARPNEVYDACFTECGKGCNVDPRLIRCAPEPNLGDPGCIAGCRCADGYKRNENGICVHESECQIFCNENEVPDNCINGGCYSARNCSQMGRPEICVDLIEGACIRGCLCAKGYLRNEETGTCVPEKECPGQNQCTRPNEIYVNCPDCSPQTCETINNIYDCPLETNDNCKGECRCKPGYFRNKIGDCISKENCLKCTGEHEFFSCGGACDNVCATLSEQNQTSCPIINIKCNEMCYCEEGYARDENGECVPFEECAPQPEQCRGENEIASNCINFGCFGARKCSEINRPVICIDPIDQSFCKKGCLCADGYLRDDNTGKCVLKTECPEQCRGENEIASNCINFGCFGARNCSEINRPVICIDPIDPSFCKNGCVCAEGFLRDDNTGECVPETKCPDPICEKNEELNECFNGGCWDARYCSEIGNPTVCARPQYCIKGCLCVEGYVRDDATGQCIPINECPEQCRRENEVASNCINFGCFGARNCSEINRPVICIDPIDPSFCKKGCVCAEGFLRDDNTGECVPETKCPDPICEENEEFNGCANGGCWDARYCSEVGNVGTVCARPAYCIKGCLCIEGYVRDDDTGKCVPIKECPNLCPGKNQYFDECPPSCSPQSCQNVTIDCIEDCECKPACRCKDGFLRNNDDECVPKEDCQKCNGPNEYYNTCAPICSPQTCQSLVGPRPQCLPAFPGQCFGACRCTEGHFRNSEGICIAKDKCELCTGKNEEYNECPPRCTSESCASLYEKPLDCDPQIQLCVPACTCQKGFYRNDDGDCIPKNDCQQCRRENEVASNCMNFGCFGARNCSEINRPVICIDPIDPSFCKKGCVCAEGFLRDDNTGECVPETKCPDPICEENEELNGCANGGCWDARYCSEVGNVGTVCARPAYCIKGCLCIEGYVRDDDTGKCVPIKECPNVCPGKNQYFDECPPSCSPQSCQNVTIDCIEDCECKPACRCKDGFLRNNDDECVPKEDCQKCNGLNEYYNTCTPICSPQTCQSLVGPRPQCLPVFPGQCFGACRCIEGHFRNSEDICIPKDKCELCTGKNEEYNECPPRCTSESCASLYEKPLECEPQIQLCVPACTCQKGFYRNDDGDCIPKNDCKQCRGENEVASNCINFGCFGARNCSEINRPVICIDPIDPSFCKKGCLCADGYLRDDNTGECVPETKCPDPICEENEELNGCANGGCWDARYCSEVGNVGTVCARPAYCIKGCLCIEGYVLDDDTGKCVAIKECPNLCPGKNQYFEECPPSCSPQSCQNVTIDCIEDCECKPACRCKDGFLRNNDDECVPKEDCQKCNGPNEYYNTCVPICSPQTCQSLVGPRPQCLPAFPGQCFGACRCIEGHFRNSEGICIPKDKCELCTGKNEEYNECPSRCTSESCASLYEKPLDCDPQIQLCVPACTCQKGFYRNDEGDCIPKNDCPCKIGERFLSDDGCNTCICGNGSRGSSACTLRACITAGPVET